MTGRAARVAGTLAAAGLAAAAARGAYRLLRARPPGGEARWQRTNHRGEPITLLEGPALAAAATAGAAVTPGLGARTRAALAVAGAAAAAFGGYDDLAGNRDRRGFRGHLGALARGEVTTGAVKIGGIGAAGVAAAALIGGPAADLAVNASLVAGSANLVNLFDLRPGRAIKVAAAGGALLAASAPGRAAGAGPGRPGGARLVAAPLGAALAMAPEDLGERAMLGDAGANALGAMLGVGVAATLPRPARLAVLAGIVGLTAASEVVSFTKVIEQTPALRWADMLGRRPAASTSPGRAPGGTQAGDASGRPRAATAANLP